MVEKKALINDVVGHISRSNSKLGTIGTYKPAVNSNPYLDTLDVNMNTANTHTATAKTHTAKAEGILGEESQQQQSAPQIEDEDYSANEFQRED